MKKPVVFVAVLFAGVTFAFAPLAGEGAKQGPFPLLNPPPNVTPEQTRGWFPYSFDTGNPRLAHGPYVGAPLPKPEWTAEMCAAYEKRIDWFHRAKFGIMFHFLPRMMRGPQKGEVWQTWTAEKWNAWVNAIDVEKTADQAKELHVGYVIISLGQGHQYFCAPNPVIESCWKIKPGEFASKRDLPLDLAESLKKRGIATMFYTSTDTQYGLPSPAGMSREARYGDWLKVLRWYSDHYGKLCRGWWLDGLNEFIPDYRVNVVAAVKHGNPDALVCSGSYEISDFLHGHCEPGNWNKQRRLARPFFGRWDPVYNIQWHAFLTIGSTWGATDAPKKTEDLVKYASDIVKGGGVITFDVGTFKGAVGPFLEIQPRQFEQLKAVGKALKDIPASDGSGRLPPP